MTLRAVIVDDEAVGRQAVREHCAAHPDIQVVAECASGVEAVDVIRDTRPQLAFLDVQMKPVTGIELAAQLPAEDLPVVVFVTAFDQYAVRAFELNAVDYLLKPFDADRFATMLARVRARVGDRLTPLVRRELKDLVLAAARHLQSGGRATEDERLIIEVGGRVSFVDPRDVESVAVDRNYVIITAGDRSFRVRATLGSVEARLAHPRFVRIHRSAIVNTAMIRSLEKWFHGEYVIEMNSGRRFRSGRTYRRRIQGLTLRRRGEDD